MVKTLFQTDLVVMHSDAATKEAALAELAERLIAGKYVHASFTQAVLHREDQFPTGLPTSPIGVAIPHTDIEHVVSPAIAVSILANPVQFNEMGNPDNTVEVRIIFMLAVNTPHMQLELLQRLIRRISDPESLTLLANAQDKQAVLEVIGA